ncbi:MAG: phosphopyruvate hydratase, partial [Planctomycetota bacterium]
MAKGLSRTDFSISGVSAREVLDSRGNPTVEVDVRLRGGGFGRFLVPSGASTGSHEAVELRDGGKRYGGKGVRRAVKNVIQKIAPAVKGMDAGDHAAVDARMLELDGTAQKKRLGANAILGVSLASARAAADAGDRDLYRWLGGPRANLLPVPLMNVLNGGAHADNNVDVQEFMLVPLGFSRFSDALRAGTEIFHALKSILRKGGYSTAVGDEGGFAPDLPDNERALRLLMRAIENAGYKPGRQVALALDVAASELWKDGAYHLPGEKRKNPLTGKALAKVFTRWSEKYPIVSIEDPFDEDDHESFGLLTEVIGDRVQIVGDDLLVTSPDRVKTAIKAKSCNAV